MPYPLGFRCLSLSVERAQVRQVICTTGTVSSSLRMHCCWCRQLYLGALVGHTRAMAPHSFLSLKCPFGPAAHSIISSTADKVLVPHTRIFLLNSVVIHCCKVAQGLKLYLVGTGVSYACHFPFCKKRIEQPPHTGCLFYMAFVDNGPMTPFNLLFFGSWLSSTLLHSQICTLTTLPASVTNFYT